MKKQRFNKVIGDIAAKKAFFMSFVRHPSYALEDGIRNLLDTLSEAMQTKEYQDMVRDSDKKTEEVTELKRKYHQARLAIKRARFDVENSDNTQLAKKYKNGELARELSHARRAYDRKKHTGLAALLEGE